MRCAKRASALVLALLLCAQSLGAQQSHIAGAQALDKAVADHAAREQADRQMVLGVLDRPEMRQQAARMGLSLDRARTAVTTMSGADLQQVAAQAQKVDAALAGGASTITMQTTTIIIILLVVILLIVALK